MKLPFDRSVRLDRKLRKLDDEKKLYDKRMQIREKKKEMRTWKLPTTTKIIMALLLINCTVVEIYSMVVMVYLQSLDALYSLITAVIGETISFLIYAAKSYGETKQEETIKLEREKLERSSTDSDQSDD